MLKTYLQNKAWTIKLQIYGSPKRQPSSADPHTVLHLKRLRRAGNCRGTSTMLVQSLGVVFHSADVAGLFVTCRYQVCILIRGSPEFASIFPGKRKCFSSEDSCRSVIDSDYSRRGDSSRFSTLTSLPYTPPNYCNLSTLPITFVY